MSETDAYLVFRDDLPDGERVARALADGYGAEDDDEVVEVRLGGRHGRGHRAALADRRPVGAGGERGVEGVGLGGESSLRFRRVFAGSSPLDERHPDLFLGRKMGLAVRLQLLIVQRELQPFSELNPLAPGPSMVPMQLRRSRPLESALLKSA